MLTKLRKLVKQHIQKFTFAVNVLYPAHDDRTESAEFRHAKEHLVGVLDTPCYICGIRKSEGGHMEAHHMFAEYSLENSLDIEYIDRDHPHFTANNDLPITSADSEGNMLILCEFCHRGKPTRKSLHHPRNKHKTAGIHAMDFPTWIAQKYRIKGKEILAEAVDEAI